MKSSEPCPIVVLISGSGSNLQALIDHDEHGVSYQIVGVVSNRPDVGGLLRAQVAQIPTTVIDHTAFTTRSEFEIALLQAIKQFHPKFVVLAGFMRILSGSIIHAVQCPILNIHPALLPKFKGLHTHQRALDAGEKEHGVTIHFVSEECDGGPIIAQTRVPIMAKDTEKSLAERVLRAEHWLYPQIVTLLAQNRLNFNQNTVKVDDKEVSKQGLQLPLPTVQGIVS